MPRFFKGLLGLEQGARSLPISTPDITRMQVAAGLKFIATAAVSFSVLTPPEAEAVTGASGLICTGLVVADAVIRKGRAQAIAAKILAGVHGTGTAGSHSPLGELAGVPLPPAPTLQQEPKRDDAGGQLLVDDGTGAPMDAQARAAVGADAAQEPAAATEAPTGVPISPPTAAEIDTARKAAADAQVALQALLARVPAQQ